MWRIAFSLAARGIEKNPASADLYTRLVYAAVKLNDPDISRKTLDILHLAVSQGLKPDTTLLTLLPGIGGLNDSQMVAILCERGFAIKRDRDYYRATLENYRRLADFAADRGIIYLAMQYPTGKVEALKNLFSLTPKLDYPAFAYSIYAEFPGQKLEPKYRRIIFVDNECFNKFLGPGDYEEYFTDRFTRPHGRFGHTTAKGHALIARNAVRAIIENWAEISRRAQ